MDACRDRRAAAIEGATNARFAGLSCLLTRGCAASWLRLTPMQASCHWPRTSCGLQSTRPISSKRALTSWSVASMWLPWHGGSRGTPRSPDEAANNPQLRRGRRKVGASELHEIMILGFHEYAKQDRFCCYGKGPNPGAGTDEAGSRGIAAERRAASGHGPGASPPPARSSLRRARRIDEDDRPAGLADLWR